METLLLSSQKRIKILQARWTTELPKENPDTHLKNPIKMDQEEKSDSVAKCNFPIIFEWVSWTKCFNKKKKKI